MNQSDKREQQIRLAALEENFPNRPAECTRRRMKPYMDACDCAWCRRVNEAWEQTYRRPEETSEETKIVKTFFHFSNGHQIDDYTINNWIRQCLEQVESGESHWSISSGDTFVVALRFDTAIQVKVANSSGYSVVRFSLTPGYEDAIEFEPYVRPTKGK